MFREARKIEKQCSLTKVGISMIPVKHPCRYHSLNRQRKADNFSFGLFVMNLCAYNGSAVFST